MDILFAVTSNTLETWQGKGQSLMVNFLILLDDFLATDTLNANYLMSHPI